jgi:uncharacterized RDD family membrane protein YckC/DNA-directed RNA polymerase subunit RPC12/RpoP
MGPLLTDVGAASMTALLEQIQYRCTRCFRSLTADSAAMGTETNCEHCGQALLVPDQETLAAEQAAYAPIQPRFRDRTFGSDAQVIVPELSFSIGDRLAPLWKRLVSSIVDNFLLLLAFVAGAAAVVALVANGFVDKQALQSKEFNLDQLNSQAVLYFPVVLLLLTQWNLIASRGQSLGKMLLGMKIVDRQGGNPGFLAGVVLRNWLRFFLSFIPFFGFIDWVVIFGESRRCIHDYLAGTHVVDVD